MNPDSLWYTKRQALMFVPSNDLANSMYHLTLFTCQQLPIGQAVIQFGQQANSEQHFLSFFIAKKSIARLTRAIVDLVRLNSAIDSKKSKFSIDLFSLARPNSPIASAVDPLFFDRAQQVNRFLQQHSPSLDHASHAKCRTNTQRTPSCLNLDTTASTTSSKNPTTASQQRGYF